MSREYQYAVSDQKTDVQLPKPVMKSSNKKLIGSAKDRSCQATISYKKQKKCKYNDSKSQSTVKVCSIKNCPEMNVQLPKPTVPYEYRILCKDKNCQSTRFYNFKKKSPMEPIHNYDKNCQSV